VLQALEDEVAKYASQNGLKYVIASGFPGKGPIGMAPVAPALPDDFMPLFPVPTYVSLAPLQNPERVTPSPILYQAPAQAPLVEPNVSFDVAPGVDFFYVQALYVDLWKNLKSVDSKRALRIPWKPVVPGSSRALYGSFYFRANPRGMGVEEIVGPEDLRKGRMHQYQVSSDGKIVENPRR